MSSFEARLRLVRYTPAHVYCTVFIGEEGNGKYSGDLTLYREEWEKLGGTMTPGLSIAITFGAVEDG